MQFNRNSIKKFNPGNGNILAQRKNPCAFNTNNVTSSYSMFNHVGKMSMNMVSSANYKKCAACNK